MKSNVTIQALAVDPASYTAPTNGLSSGTEIVRLVANKRNGRLLVSGEQRVAVNIKITGAPNDDLAAAAAYAAGDVIGGSCLVYMPDLVTTLQPANGFMLEQILLIDGDKQVCPIDVFVFGGAILSTIFTDNGPLALDSADRDRLLGIVKVVGTDYSDTANHSIASKTFPLPGYDLLAVQLVFVARAAATWTVAVNKNLRCRAVFRLI